MALGIHKPGEGYWVRVMTACMIAVAAIATASWVFGQSALIAESLPRNRFDLSFTSGTGAVTGSVDTGAQVTVYAEDPAASGATKLGTARVIGVDPGRAITVTDLTLTGGLDPTSIKGVATDTGSFRAKVDQAVGRAAVSETLLGGILASLVLVAGAVIAYWLTGVKVGTVERLIATDYEMRKVNWSTPKEILGSTWVVIGACVILAAALWMFDYVFQLIVTNTGVL